MKDYVCKFYKLKLENSGVLTPEKCNELNEQNKKCGLNFTVDASKTCENPGLRQVAKICLNSLWGKFGQRTSLSSYEFIDSYDVFLDRLCSNTIVPQGWNIINENMVEMRFLEDIENQMEAEFISEVTAVFTTANARLRLYDLLYWLHPSQI